MGDRIVPIRYYTLLTDAPKWDAMEIGAKNFAIVRDDHAFQRGDGVIARRADPEHPLRPDYDHVEGEYRELRFEITFVQHSKGVEPGHVVLGLKRIPG